jgi:glycosyltransferase involved in cell wall biosynthesis
VLHVKGLPPGWLGKNHALHFGAIHATGELILFTDADIVMEPSAISRAVRYLTEKELDHLAVLMEARMPGVVLGMFALGFGVFFSIYSRFWRARNPRSGAHVGIGGFNLIRAEVYRAVGGHRPIAMRPDDDMKLGKLIKQSGYRQDLLFGRGLMYVEWYASLAELVRGLEKNTFAGVGYSVFQLVASSVALLAFAVLPFAAVFFAQGATRGLYLFTSLSIIAMCAYGARMQNIKPWYAVGFPLISLLFLFIVWRSAVLTLLNGGINWRGTHYSLAELRENKLRRDEGMKR